MTAPAVAPPTPWLSIWIRPRATLRQIVDAGPSHSALIISAAWGIVQSMLQGAQNNIGAKASAPLILVTASAIGAVWGLLQLYVLSSLFYLVGRVTDTKTPFTHVRSAVAWSSVPLAATLGLWLLGTLLFGRSFFLSTEVVTSTGNLGLLLSMSLLYLVTLALWVWSLVILVQGLAEVQGVSVGKAIGTVVVGLLLLGVVAILIVVFAVLVFWQ